jgi:all-trans-retinol dehydrogenase (NAD+)
MARGTPLRWAGVVITGAGSEIGRLLMLDCAARGARVVGWDKDGEAVEAVAAEARAAGGRAWAYAVDVTDRDQVAKAAAWTKETIERVDVVVNNAGVVTGHRLIEASDDEIERTFAVNTLALFWVTKAFLPDLLERNHGCIVTVASAAGLMGVARLTDYSASKFAAVGFTESLRAELRAAKSAVRTVTVTPYYIDTGMFDGVRTKFPLVLPILQPQDVADRIVAAIEGGKGWVAMPPLVRMLPAMRILPVRLFDAVAEFFGVNRTMDHFTGRLPADKD